MYQSDVAQANHKTDWDESVMKTQSMLFRALGDAHRLKILSLLSTYGEMSVMDIGKILEQSQPAVSHHLRELRAANLIDFRRDGKFNYYHLNEVGIRNLFQVLCPKGSMKLTIAGVEMILRQK